MFVNFQKVKILKKSREIMNSNSKYLGQDCELYGDGMLKLTYKIDVLLLHNPFYNDKKISKSPSI